MNTKRAGVELPSQLLSNRLILGIIASYGLAFIVFGFLMSSPGENLNGLIEIITTRDALITDYIGVGGIGAAFVNAGLLTCLACLLYRITQASISGASIASLFLLLGFSLFGKNLLNVWPIIAGVWLYAKFRNESFAAYINIAFFGCALAPIFSEILYSTAISRSVSIPLALFTALLLGFILSPVATQLFKAHAGFNLYNIGFTAGVIGTLVVALYKSYGYVPDPVMIWTSENQGILTGFLVILFLSMLIVGIFLDRQSLGQLSTLLTLPALKRRGFLVHRDYLRKTELLLKK
jgi:hypothetical protein